MINRHTHNFLTWAKAEIWALKVCIVVNGEKFQSHAVTLTLIGQCPMSNSSELFSCTTVCSNFTSIEPLFLELSCTQTDRHQHRQTDTQTTMSIQRFSIWTLSLRLDITTGNIYNDTHIDKRIGACRRSFYFLQLAGMCKL